MTATIALIGDYSPEVVAHRAILRALELARDELGAAAEWRWVRTRDVRDAARDLAGYAGMWLVPASPYENTAGALAAVRFARENRVPFLGTCGGFQHALIEFARNVAHLAGADHAETNPAAPVLVVTRLTCSLVEQTEALHFEPASRIAGAYSATRAIERYHCNYGPAAAYREKLERAGLRFTAFNPAGEVRGGELPAATHPFFVGTLFQPERAALCGKTPPLARAFMRAAGSR